MGKKKSDLLEVGDLSLLIILVSIKFFVVIIYLLDFS